MRLIAIRLAGFKSFVDPTTLALCSNLTGIVGPNGCGKSNVIDAVRWVTGESSARQLRGEALEDVIFNGSRTRKPVGRASVELRFDNSEGKLGGQYGAFGEISVKRELARDGASRYTINGTRARRRDVIDLFLGTGLGGRSNYAVIEQGAINRLIEARPEDMRQILEETAGISRYKERRRETENRIRHTRENLDRLNDLIGEVVQRLGVLKRQAASAEKYKEYKAEDRRLRAELLALRWSVENTRVETAEARLRACENTLRDAVSVQREAQTMRDEHGTAQQAATTHVQDRQAAFYDAQSKASRIAQALAHAREMQEMRTRQRNELVDRIETLTARKREETQAAKAAAAERETRNADYAHCFECHGEAREALAVAEQAAHEAERAWDAHNDVEYNPLQQFDAERTRASYSRDRLQQLQSRRAARIDERAQLGEEDNVVLDATDRDIAARAQQLETDQQAARDVAAHEERLRETIGTAETALDGLRTELGEQRARLASERKLQQSVLREDDARLRQWLQANGHSDAEGVARRVSVREGWQTAAEAALGPWLRGFLVAALPAIEDWPAEPLTLVEADSGEPRRPAADGPDGVPSLADGLQAPAMVRDIAAAIFVVDDVAAALARRAELVPDQRLVTLDGCIVGPASLTSPAGESAEQGVLERESRIAQLATAVDAQQRRFDTDEQTLIDQRARQRELNERRQRSEQAIDEARRRLEADRAEQQGERMRAEQRQQRRREIDAELSELAAQIEASEDELQTLDARAETLALESERFVTARQQAQAQLTDARETRNAARTRCDAAEAKMLDLEAKRSQLDNRLHSIESRRQDHAQALADVAQRLAAFDAELGGQPTDAPDEAEHEQAIENQNRAERELRAARETLQACETALQQQSQRLMQAEQDVEAAREQLQKAQIEVETAGVRRAGVAEQLEALGERAQPLLDTLADDASVDRWNAEIESVERRIQRLGAINLAAIEEYGAEAERESYLQEQHADLAQALETLENAIAKIDRETRQRFKATYEQVNSRFAALFPELFGGGEAGLVLTEEDWLATGIRVMARPPGKRNASIQMLSGGEKALTAVALLFALFELNPAPFCMLDEIDAPLDDANVSRFCDLVRRMSAQVQFIVITHNKLTMTLTEQLHGVTMAEPGVSRLVSVDVDQALDMVG